MSQIYACLFDKDGTLFDFHATWSNATGDTIRALAEGDPSLIATLAEAISYDLATDRLQSDSIAVAGTNEQIALQLVPHLNGWTVGGIVDFFEARIDLAPLTPAVPLAPFLQDLSGRGLKLGVMTNDSEHGAKVQLSAAGVLDRFDFVCGADSGFGAKPSPTPLLAFAEATEIAPEHIVMVGDSTHDLHAGRAAGMTTVGVLTGLAQHQDLAPFADAVLPDIGGLPGWIAARNGQIAQS